MGPGHEGASVELCLAKPRRSLRSPVDETGGIVLLTWVRFDCKFVGKVGHPLAVHCQGYKLNPRGILRFVTAPSPMLSFLSNESCPAPRRVVA